MEAGRKPDSGTRPMTKLGVHAATRGGHASATATNCSRGDLRPCRVSPVFESAVILIFALG